MTDWELAQSPGTPLAPQEYREAYSDANLRWYVIHTQPHAEERAVDNLERQAYTIFCPRIAKTIRHARKVTKAHVPLFPNYLFVRLDPQRDQWRPINGTRGVVKILTQGDVPIAVPKGVVEEVQSRINAAGVVDWTASLALGQKVRISSGPFADLIGQIEYLDGAGRVRVLLSLMGRTVSVQTRTEMLSPTDKAV